MLIIQMYVPAEDCAFSGPLSLEILTPEFFENLLDGLTHAIREFSPIDCGKLLPCLLHSCDQAANHVGRFIVRSAKHRCNQSCRALDLR